MSGVRSWLSEEELRDGRQEQYGLALPGVNHVVTLWWHPIHHLFVVTAKVIPGDKESLIEGEEWRFTDLKQARERFSEETKRLRRMRFDSRHHLG